MTDSTTSTSSAVRMISTRNAPPVLIPRSEFAPYPFEPKDLRLNGPPTRARTACDTQYSSSAPAMPPANYMIA
ncbi:MAG TPA: hypothetical protein VGS97_21950 [Actinocrinis sp.]|nr:hypothetical protein [Actinocrinis sp.]